MKKPRLAFILFACIVLSMPLPEVLAADRPSASSSNFPNDDPDGDGLTNQEEAEAGTYPYNAYSDADLVMDGLDGWALNANLAPPRIPIAQYVVIPIDLGGDRPVAINNSAQVAASSNWTASFWEKGEKTALPVPPSSDTSGIWPVDINDSGLVLCNGWTYGNGPSGIPQGSRSYSGIWQKGGALTELFSFFGTEGTEKVRAGSFAVSMNDVGQVVGSAEDGKIHYDDQGVPSYNEDQHSPSALWSTAGGSPAHLLPDDQSWCVIGQAINNHGVSAVARFGSGQNLISVIANGTETSLGEGYPNCINDDNIIVGWRANQSTIWYKKNGNGPWISEALDVDGAINNRYQIIGSHNSKGVVWQNAKSYTLSELGPSRVGWSDYIDAIDINDQGVILASSFRVSDGKPVTSTGMVPILLVPVDIVPDYNHDGVIDNKDPGKITKDNPFHIWINDDNDSGDTGGDDQPGTSVPNYADDVVNGVRDLVDFFPISLELKQLVETLPPDTYTYELRSSDGALNAIIPTMGSIAVKIEKSNSRAYLTSKTIGQLLTNPLAKSVHLTSGSNTQARLSEEFLNNVKNDGAGVILLEGRGETPQNSTSNLEVHVLKGTEDVATISFPMKLSSVEKMFRHKNFLAAGGGNSGDGRSDYDGAANGNGPENFPDKLCSSKYFVFVHGYNVNGQQARGWDSEMFKRMYWSASKAKFYGVTWYGYESQGSVPFLPDVTPNYEANVLNAFSTAAPLASLLNQLRQRADVYVAGHSLANMLIGSAISDYSANPTGYFMLDAAVAKEAYADSEEQLTQGGQRGMEGEAHDSASVVSWATYDRHLWCSDWRLLFDGSDNRSRLTWKNRLSNVMNVATYNFFSSGEEVLANPSGPPYVPLSANEVWNNQERLKGYAACSNYILTSNYGGWKLSSHYQNVNDTMWTPIQANQISNDQLKSFPFFKSDEPTELFAQSGSAYAADNARRNTLLAEMVPALSFAAGSNSLSIAGSTRNFDMNLLFKNGWPTSRGDNTSWHHSDTREVAYTYIHALFDKWVELAELKK